MAAAVADYRPAEAGDSKRARDGDWSLELVPTADILAAIGAPGARARCWWASRPRPAMA